MWQSIVGLKAKISICWFIMDRDWLFKRKTHHTQNMFGVKQKILPCMLQKVLRGCQFLYSWKWYNKHSCTQCWQKWPPLVLKQKFAYILWEWNLKNSVLCVVSVLFSLFQELFRGMNKIQEYTFPFDQQIYSQHIGISPQFATSLYYWEFC